MSERRVLTEDDAYALLAHLLASAELHTIEPASYADRRFVEGAKMLIDAMAESSGNQGWPAEFRDRIDAALAARRSDPDAYLEFVRTATGDVGRQLRQRASQGAIEAEADNDE